MRAGLRAQGMARQEYYEFCRSDVLSCVPPSARTVLSVGCGAGATEECLVQMGCYVVGIEKEVEIAGMARGRGLQVICADVEQLELRPVPTFDCLIYADVLEHLRAPERLLARHVALLVDGGSVVVSVPNFRFLPSVAALAAGSWEYQDAGICDRTHLRITTRRIVDTWLRDAGLTVERCIGVFHRRRWRWLARLAAGCLDELMATQLILVARKVREQ